MIVCGTSAGTSAGDVWCALCIYQDTVSVVVNVLVDQMNSVLLALIKYTLSLCH